jgi:hypothetical protein
VNLDDLDRILRDAGHPGIHSSPRTSYDGSTMTITGDRDNGVDTTFASEDALCRWVLTHELRWSAPRRGAVAHQSAIAPIAGAAIWQVSLPLNSELRARGNGILAVLDSSGVLADPERGAMQVTILASATGAVLASWLPPHGAMWPRVENGHLVVDDGRGTASMCETLTGRVVGQTTAGVREKWADPLVPNILQRGTEVTRLESAEGTLLWERPGWVWSTARRQEMSIITTTQATVVETVRDDGTSVWTRSGSLATASEYVAWIDAGATLDVVDIATGNLLSSTPVPWGNSKLNGLCSGWDPADGVIVVDTDTTLAVYPAR